MALLVHPRALLFEYAVVMELFESRPTRRRIPWYEVTTVSETGGDVVLSPGVVVSASADVSQLARYGTVVIPGWVDADEVPSEALVAALREAAHRGTRMVSLCSGAYLLAYAGLLDGRRATTHWWYRDDFRERFPAVTLDQDALYVVDGDRLSSAGLAAGIDLCLAVIASDMGPAAAVMAARRMVSAPHRRGGQGQFILDPVLPDSADSVVEAVRTAADDTEARVSLRQLASAAHVSERTLRRRFQRRTGDSPLRYVIRRRLQHAQHLLETTALSVELVATRSGFSSAERFRHHFRQVLETTPSAYREQFHLPGSAS